MLDKSIVYKFLYARSNLWAWSTLSELFAYPDGSKFSLGQRGSDNRGWTVLGFFRGFSFHT